MNEKRENEIRYMNQCYQTEDISLVVIYGRTQIKREELIVNFVKEHNGHYICASPCSERQQQFHMGEQVSYYEKYFIEFPSFKEILNEHVKNDTTRSLIVIDEIQHLLKVSNSFLTDLVTFLHENNCLVVLSSSDVGWVENHMIGAIGSQVAQMISGFLKISESDFSDCISYFPSYSYKEVMLIYRIFGGVSEYWEIFNPSLSIKENICNKILSNNSFVILKEQKTILEQLREPAVYYTLLAALANGKNKLNDIFLHTGFSRAKISVYLKNLMELELVTKVFSVDTKGHENAQKGVYKISNCLVEFWFKFMFPHYAELNFLKPDEFYDKYIDHYIEAYSLTILPSICREYMTIMNESESLPIVCDTIGEWLGKAGNIPVVGKDDSENILVCFCNERPGKITAEDFEWFKYCLDQAQIEPLKIYLFSIAGFDEEIIINADNNPNIVLIDLK